MPGFINIAPRVGLVRCGIVNAYVLGDRSRWVLVDAGLNGFAGRIRRLTGARFGPGSRPEAIILTHGHFDHVGSLDALLRDWDVPVFVHQLEMPYVTGRSPYPPPDPLVGRGMMALLSRAYPRGPIDLGSRARQLPSDGAVPGAPEWRWVPTPGHTPGHVSLFRERDRCLVAGDAVCTTRQESLVGALTQHGDVHGPPAYFTQDWDAARESVRRLAALAPEYLASGHGEPRRGEVMRARLSAIAEHFDRLERPRFGRYVREPAIADESGTVALPPDPLPKVLGAAAGAATLALLVWKATQPRRHVRAAA